MPRRALRSQSHAQHGHNDLSAGGSPRAHKQSHPHNGKCLGRATRMMRAADAERATETPTKHQKHRPKLKGSGHAVEKQQQGHQVVTWEVAARVSATHCWIVARAVSSADCASRAAGHMTDSMTSQASAVVVELRSSGRGECCLQEVVSSGAVTEGSTLPSFSNSRNARAALTA